MQFIVTHSAQTAHNTWSAALQAGWATHWTDCTGQCSAMQAAGLSAATPAPAATRETSTAVRWTILMWLITQN